MEKMLEILKEILKNEYVSKFLIALITAIITHFFTIRKIKREQSIKYKAELGNKIGNTYIELREIISKLTSIEIYGITNQIPSINNILNLKDNVIYPSFMSTYDSLCDSLKEISNARAKHEEFLDISSASMLYGLERYLFSLICYVAENDFTNDCDFVGCIVISDVQKIKLDFDKLLVRRLNHPLYKLFHQKSIFWSLRKKWVEYNYLKKSYLSKLIKKSIIIPDEVLLELKEKDNQEVTINDQL